MHFVRVRTEERRSLKCNKCRVWRFLKIKKYKVVQQGIEIDFVNFPVLVCPKCGKECLSEKGENELRKFIRLAKSKNTNKLEVSKKYIKDFNKKKFFYKGSLEFDYCYLDSEFIPGLRRFSAGGALIPVFFKIKVLLKYLSDPQYGLYFSSDSYGHIYKGKHELISFGINRNNKVIFWYCDLYKLQKKEQHYLISENIRSDHDIGSDFYIAEIRAEYPKPSKEIQLEGFRAKLNNKFGKRYKFNLYTDGIENIRAIRDIIKPIIWNKKWVKDTIQSLHLLHIESLNEELLKLEITKLDSSINLKNIDGSINLLKQWLDLRFKKLNSQTIVAPLYALNTFRNIFSHKKNKTRYNKDLRKICKKLNLPENTKNLKVIYESLIKELTNSYDELSKVIKIRKSTKV